MKLKIWEMSLIFALVITTLCGFMTENDRTELSEKIIRLHIVANSDTDIDQDLKIDVRDEVLKELANIVDVQAGKDEAEEMIEKNIDDIILTAEREIKSQGFDYEVTAKITEEYFPTREYETFSLPAGKYTSLRIIIGAGEGHNWWCVVYPSLCTGAALESFEDAVGLTDDEISLITENGKGYVIKFKIMELFGKIQMLFGK